MANPRHDPSRANTERSGDRERVGRLGHDQTNTASDREPRRRGEESAAEEERDPISDEELADEDVDESDWSER